MPPGGGGEGAWCTGHALCLSSDNHIGVLSGLCREDAWCFFTEVMNDVIVDSTATSLRCRGTAVNIFNGRIVHTLFSTDTCDPGAVPFILKIPQFENCLFLPPEIPSLPPNICFANNYYWNYFTNQCSEEIPSCPGHCSPYWPLESGVCDSPIDYCGYQWGCPFGLTDGGSGCCCGPTPIVIDFAGNGFDLTNVHNGIHFDMGGDGHSEPIAWTSAGSDDAWLVLDRNSNGVIDNATEMFGNFTDQPHATTARNGFVALTEFDRTDQGGNNDGEVSSADSVFARLRLWQDVNHNGESEPEELSPLASRGIAAIELKYKQSKRTDENGNHFAVRAKIKDINGVQLGGWAWDVTLDVNPPPQ
ncbi:MAG TPA: hypothetical protein VFS76_10830 [Pyrinomonadaceae bacterium]|nr:hypothetical protein [Pyrinomonadaceae bacterium]